MKEFLGVDYAIGNDRKDSIKHNDNPPEEIESEVSEKDTANNQESLKTVCRTDTMLVIS